MSASQPPIIDFLAPGEKEHWKTVDDPVMGGRSHSEITWLEEEHTTDEQASSFLRFHGRISLANGGGFCSTRLTERARPASGAQTIRLRLRGDRKRYKITLRTSDTRRASSWRYPITTSGQSWEHHDIPLDAFELWRRGQLLDAEGWPDPAHLTSAGILIADKQQGPFQLDISDFQAL